MGPIDDAAVDTRRTRATAHLRSPFVPLLVLSLTVLGWLAFQCVQLLREQTALETAYAGQARTVEEATKLRGALDVLARETQLLSDKGNASARLVVDELRKRGVTINPDAARSAK